MTAQFTPGPWAVERDPYTHIRAKDGWGSTVYAADYPPSDADARLIAAAPELYEALQVALPYLDRPAVMPTAERDKITATLAKARGDA